MERYSYHQHLNYASRGRRRKSKWKKLFITLSLLVVVLFAAFVGVAVFAPDTFVIKPTKPAITNRHYAMDYDGIDVSHHQGHIDWARVAQDTCVKFVYIKATEGYTHVDSLYQVNLDGARKAGLKVGSYHYFTSTSDPRKQFQAFKHFADADYQDLIPMIDVEPEGVKGWTKEEILENLKVFVALAKAHYGKIPLIYSTAKFYNETLAPDFNMFPLFLARYSPKEPVVKGAGAHAIWQHSDQGTVDGIEKPVDLDVFAKGTSLQDILLR